MKPPPVVFGMEWLRLPPLADRPKWQSLLADARAISGEWRDTKHGRRLLLHVSLDLYGLSGRPVFAYWTPAASARIIARRFGSDDPATWPDSFVLPLMIAKNVKNPKTGERKDRVWVLPADLWPDTAGGGATVGTGTFTGGGTSSGSST